MEKGVVKNFIIPGICVFAGTAAYSYLTSTPRHVEWPRAIFIGLFVALGMWGWTAFRARDGAKPPE